MTRLYSIELKVGRRWFFIEASPTLALARELCTLFYHSHTTRIRKWVRP